MSKFSQLIPVILSGGSGTRLWPISRKFYPKQFIPLRNERSLFQDTVIRTKALGHGIQSPMVICNEEHRFMAAEQLRTQDIEDAEIILEPIGRNTAPAICLAALRAKERDQDAVLLILPADHILDTDEQFSMAISNAMELCMQNHLVTFGIVPTRPETGYGYIKVGEQVSHGASKVDQFVEKPKMATAEEYVKAGNYLWNSGMFMFKAADLLSELEKHEPEILADVTKAYSKKAKDLDFIRIDKESFSQCKSESIDYAVMEKTSKATVVPLASAWNDVGSWHALWESSQQDEKKNAVTGDVILEDCEGCYVHSSNRLIAAIGMQDVVIVETADAVMVTPRDQAQKVKNIVEKLKETGRDESEIHLKVYRPWGDYQSIDNAERFQVKRITVKPKERLSLQKHHHRAEHWIVVNGTAIVTCDDKEFLLSENQSTYIPIGATHRLENPGMIPLELIEVQSGAYLGEDDIVRFEDIYGRSGS